MLYEVTNAPVVVRITNRLGTEISCAGEPATTAMVAVPAAGNPTSVAAGATAYAGGYRSISQDSRYTPTCVVSDADTTLGGARARMNIVIDPKTGAYKGSTCQPSKPRTTGLQLQCKVAVSGGEPVHLRPQTRSPVASWGDQRACTMMIPGRGARAHRRWRLAVVAVVVVGLGSPLLVACGNSAGDGLVVPVLWASGVGDTAQGGIERARVRVTDGDGGFSVDLADSEAQGAGPAWLAASSSAAAVATLVSGVDPSTLNVGFSVTGRIDGPSGGAALAVGVLAAIRGLELRDNVTMTGTISPDGFVGRVGAVPTKVRAAADSGFDLLLVPVANVGDRDTETGLDLVALGATLGVEVRPVADLGSAVAAFTGGPITAGPTSPPPLGPAVEVVARSTGEAMVARLAEALASSGASATARAIPTQRLESAQAALAAGDLAGAYGVATDGWLRLERDRAAEATTAAAVGSGLESERARLAAEAASVVGMADEALAGAGAGDDVPVIGRLNLPAALGWLTYARAVAEAVVTALPAATGADQLGALAATLAEQRAEVEVLWPDAEAVVRVLVDGDAPLPGDPGRFLDGYTALIVSAAQANESYLTDVLGSGGVGPVVTSTAAAASEALSTLATEGATPEVRASAALSWWFITAAEVAGQQAYGLAELGIGTDIGVPANQPALEVAIRNASETITAAAGNLASRGVDVSYPVWSSAWGVAAAAGDTDTATAEGEILALGELWYSAVTTFLLTAATSPVTT